MSLLTSVNRLAEESVKSCEEDLKKMAKEEFGTLKERTDRLNANIDSAHRGVAEVKTTLSREKLIAFLKSGKVPPELVFGERGKVSAACVRVSNRYSVAFSRNTEECRAVENSNNDRLFSTEPSDFVFVEDTYPLIKMDGDEAVFLTGVCLSSTKKDLDEEDEEQSDVDKKNNNIIINSTSYAKANTDDIFGLSKEDNGDDTSGDEDECSGRAFLANSGLLRVYNGENDSPAFSLSKLQVDDLKYGWGNKNSMSTRDSGMGFSSTRSTTKQMNDLRCFSHMFDVEVLDDTGKISIVLENGPDLYNSKPISFSDHRAAIESTPDKDDDGLAKISSSNAVDSVLAAAAKHVDIDDASSSMTYTYSPTSKYESTKTSPRASCEESATKVVSNSPREVISLFNALNDITAIASKHRRGLLVYEYENTPSSSVPTLYNPILHSAKEFLEYEKERQSLKASIDIQNVLFRIFKPVTSKIGDGSISKSKMNSMMKQISQSFDREEDVSIATCLLKDEVEATRISQVIAKEIVSSVPIIGKKGANDSISVQQERVEGMRDAIGIHSLHENAADDSLAVMTEYVTKWIKSIFMPVLSAKDVKIIKSQYASVKSSFLKPKNQNSKRSRKNDRRQGEVVQSNKRAKLESGPREHYSEESTDKDKISVATVLPPSFINVPKEAVSDTVLSECLHCYAEDVAHVLLSFSSPKREATLASLTNVIPIIKKKISDIMGKLAVYMCKSIIRPVEIFSSPNNIRIGEVQANKLKHVFVDQSNVKSKLANLISNSTSFNHNIPASNEEECNISKNLYGALNVRRLAEENAAFKHLSNVMILENICKILSGRSMRFSPIIQNAFKWYLIILIRNRICENIPRLKGTDGTMYESIASDHMNLAILSDQIYNAITWFIEFEIPHQLVFDWVPGYHEILKPGVRQAAIIPYEYIGSSSHPIEMTTLCPGSSIPRTVRIDGKHADTLLCVNNYDSGNLMLISMNSVKTLKECKSVVFPEASKNKKTMSMTSLFPDFVMKSNSSKTLALVTGGGDEHFARKNTREFNRRCKDKYYHLFKNARKVQYKAEQFLDQKEAIPLIMYCSFNIWKNLPLFGVNFPRLKFKLNITKNSKMMLSVSERVWRNSPLDGLLYKSYVDSVDNFFVKKPAVIYDSISDFDIVVHNCGADGDESDEEFEVARCHFVNESLSEGSDSVLFLPRYRATAVKNSSAVRKFIKGNSKNSSKDAEWLENCIIKYSSANTAQRLSPVCNASLHPYMLKIRKMVRSNVKQKLKYMKIRRY